MSDYIELKCIFKIIRDTFLPVTKLECKHMTLFKLFLQVLFIKGKSKRVNF
jgi:hypothetical protein